MEAHAEKVWKIVGYDGTKKFFERVLPLGSLSEGEMTSLLQRLAAQHLTSDEIVPRSDATPSPMPRCSSRNKKRVRLPVGFP